MKLSKIKKDNVSISNLFKYNFKFSTPSFYARGYGQAFLKFLTTCKVNYMLANDMKGMIISFP